ncbi:MAG: hypothetical protein ACREIT_01895, partial [Tepidisphaeraceae bacterium]
MRDADVFYAIVGNTGGARGTASPRCAADGQTPASGASPQPSAATKGEPKGADRRRSFRHPTGTVGVLTPFGAG